MSSIKDKYLTHDNGKSLNYYTTSEGLDLDCGEHLDELTIAYTTYGTMNADQSNVVWICHAYTANADPIDWWPGMIGEGKYFDPNKYFIVCANILGSCYGTTGPLSINPKTGKPYYRSFPLTTVRDQVRAHEVLRKHLGIKSIWLILGCSIGGHQALEWCVSNPNLIKTAIFVATNAKTTPWVTAFNEAQRMSILADPTYQNDTPDGGAAGLAAARAMALISYRNREIYNRTQSEPAANNDILDGYRANSYQRHQGDKLVDRFNAYSYYSLSKALDSHNVGRGYGDFKTALGRITARTLVIGIDTDILFPIDDQKAIHEGIANSQMEILHSDYGHDGFLLEFEKQVVMYDKFLFGK
ncbi:MAG: homoserine O-acetyltransferase [Salinivirgaceae bacterium]|nr:homoserine O-acetyltransferase [Salinivirgaceae bacterium]